MGFEHWRGRSLLPILYLYYPICFVFIFVCVFVFWQKQILVPMGFDRWKKPIAYSLSRVDEGLARK